jgi:hypothetical protein
MHFVPLTGLPDDLLIADNDPIIPLDFEDGILRFGKTVRTAASAAGQIRKTSAMIGAFAP